MTATQTEIYILEQERKWNELKNVKTGFFSSSIDLTVAIKFVLSSLDEAIRYAQDNMNGGTEKKAFVLNVVSRLYDITIATGLPYWLYPWASSIKSLVIDKLVSNMIDWVVAKYKEGLWKI